MKFKSVHLATGQPQTYAQAAVPLLALALTGDTPQRNFSRAAL